MALEIHFLSVGHGDCTIIQFPSGRVMMIDINNSKTLPDDDVVALAESAADHRRAQGTRGIVLREPI
jgi:hypothetical protein